MTQARVLIAHQSTIPHYRVAFYELLERMRPQMWQFEVLFDTRESERPTIYREAVDYRQFRFPIRDVRTSRAWIAGKQLLWQHAWLAANKYDVLVLDTHLSNLLYPATTPLRWAGQKRVLWGHVRDRNVANPGALKRLTEKAKAMYVRSSDAFFAYTDGERTELLARGYPVDKVHVLNNTIDTVGERALHLASRARRDEFRAQFGVGNRTVLLHVGRLQADKRIDFMCELFEQLHGAEPDRWHLAVVGTGSEEGRVRVMAERLGSAAVTCLGAVTDRDKLAPVFAASDLFVMPGYVGLAPLQAMCHDLPVVFFDLPVHSPEREYLTEVNSSMLPGDMSAHTAARAMPQVVERWAGQAARDRVYASIEHLTLESMAQRFVAGMNAVLAGAGH
jgi:glycosyltransferase involved in cell wall biosynthesis